MTGKLTEKTGFICGRCIESITIKSMHGIASLKCPAGSLKVIDNFCYLGDIISSRDG